MLATSRGSTGVHQTGPHNARRNIAAHAGADEVTQTVLFVQLRFMLTAMGPVGGDLTAEPVHYCRPSIIQSTQFNPNSFQTNTCVSAQTTRRPAVRALFRTDKDYRSADSLRLSGMWRFSHAATCTHCSNSVCGLSSACVSSGNTMVLVSGALAPLALSARTYSCASVSGTLHTHHMGVVGLLPTTASAPVRCSVRCRAGRHV